RPATPEAVRLGRSRGSSQGRTIGRTTSVRVRLRMPPSAPFSLFLIARNTSNALEHFGGRLCVIESRRRNPMEYQNVSHLSRRTFLLAGFVAAVGRATTYAQQQASIPETLTQWLGASAKMRKFALQRCLDRIQIMEPSIHAWVQASPQRKVIPGRLSGIPYGVKDIIETRGLATEYGSPIYKGRIGTSDAAIIREMRKHGAILLGKTQTTAFAYLTPAPTRNPRDLEHTPGGSSSGSAAAVAAGHGPFTLCAANREAPFLGAALFAPSRLQ